MKFIITAPPFNEKSAGCVMLYTLSNKLKELGYDTEIIPLTQPQVIPDDTILIYPEIIDGNPFGAKNVVRYFLNREGYVSGNKVNAGPNDFNFSFSQVVSSKSTRDCQTRKSQPTFPRS